MRSRRVVRALLAAVAGALAAAALLAPAQAGAAGSTGCTLVTRLTPSEEVRPPLTTDPVESVASGFSIVHIAGGKLAFLTVISNPARETFVAGHVHIAPAGANGPVVVGLFEGSTSSRLLVDHGVTDIGAEGAAAICGDPAGYYVNYHTTQDPQGAVRGQLG